MLTNSISAPARSIVDGTQNSRSLCGLRRSASCSETSPRRTSYDDGVPACRSVIPSAVLALPWGSRSMTRVLSPCTASAAARLTAVVVLPTPPFWFATVNTRRWVGRRSGVYVVWRTRMARSAAAPIGVSYSADVSRETSAGGGPSGATGADGCACATAGDGGGPPDQSGGELTVSPCLPSVPTSGAPAFRVVLK